jgi:hypothetical protein
MLLKPLIEDTHWRTADSRLQMADGDQLGLVRDSLIV